MSAILPVVGSYERPDLCGPCGGQCCKTAPGAALPEDFGVGTDEFESRIRSALATGRWAIDWWEGDPRDDGDGELDEAYYLRPATVGDEGRKFHGGWGGRCTFLGASGCEIFDNRPSGCRGLEPVSTDKCVVRRASKQDAAIAWIPFSSKLVEIAEGL